MVNEPEWKVMLLEIVRREGFDPWNIDVSALAREYLRMIEDMRAENLVIPANALVACSVLLQMKAKKVVEEVMPPEEEIIEIPEPEEASLEVLPHPQESMKERNVVLVPPRRMMPRRVTLDELLDAIERVMRARKSVQKMVKDVEVPPLPEVEAEDVEQMVGEVYAKILELADKEGMLTFSQLLKAFDWITALYSILFLANEGKLSVWQEKPFEEIFIAVVGNEGEENH